MSTSPQAALDLVILKTLARGPNHGFGITLHIEQASSSLLKVEEGSLYPALHRLERNELVTADWTTTENGRRARIYSLTPAGRKRLREAEKSWNQLSSGVAKVLSFS
jgi:PadR family transcriptional regulator, regulatory protein PadR